MQTQIRMDLGQMEPNEVIVHHPPPNNNNHNHSNNDNIQTHLSCNETNDKINSNSSNNNTQTNGIELINKSNNTDNNNVDNKIILLNKNNTIENKSLFVTSFKEYIIKFKGQGQISPPRADYIDMIIGFIGSLLGIWLVSFIHFYILPLPSVSPTTQVFSDSSSVLAGVIGSFGASACLLYGVPEANYSQPRNVFGGHVVSGFFGVCTQLSIGEYISDPKLLWIPAGVAVALAVFAMHLTRTIHPPGGATALIAVLPSGISKLGFMYVFMPVAVGAILLILVALIVTNFKKETTYPKYWY